MYVWLKWNTGIPKAAFAHRLTQSPGWCRKHSLNNWWSVSFVFKCIDCFGNSLNSNPCNKHQHLRFDDMCLMCVFVRVYSQSIQFPEVVLAPIQLYFHNWCSFYVVRFKTILIELAQRTDMRIIVHMALFFCSNAEVAEWIWFVMYAIDITFILLNIVSIAPSFPWSLRFCEHHSLFFRNIFCSNPLPFYQSSAYGKNNLQHVYI